MIADELDWPTAHALARELNDGDSAARLVERVVDWFGGNRGSPWWWVCHLR